jgi:hypothetical protein
MAEDSRPTIAEPGLRALLKVTDEITTLFEDNITLLETQGELQERRINRLEAQVEFLEVRLHDLGVEDLYPEANDAQAPEEPKVDPDF